MAEAVFDKDEQIRGLGQALTEGYSGMMARLGDAPDGLTLGYCEGPKATLNDLLRIAWLGGYMTGRTREPNLNGLTEQELINEAQGLAQRFREAIAEQD